MAAITEEWLIVYSDSMLHMGKDIASQLGLMGIP